MGILPSPILRLAKLWPKKKRPAPDSDRCGLSRGLARRVLGKEVVGRPKWNRFVFLNLSSLLAICSFGQVLPAPTVRRAESDRPCKAVPTVASGVGGSLEA